MDHVDHVDHKMVVNGIFYNFQGTGSDLPGKIRYQKSQVTLPSNSTKKKPVNNIAADNDILKIVAMKYGRILRSNQIK